MLPEYQIEGIGSLLIQHGLEKCREAGADAVVVLGDPECYSRFGFERASEYGLGNEYDVDEEFVVKPLREGALDNADGIVAYQPEFQRAEN